MFNFAVIDGETGKRFATIAARNWDEAWHAASKKWGTNIGVKSTVVAAHGRKSVTVEVGQ